MDNLVQQVMQQLEERNIRALKLLLIIKLPRLVNRFF